MNIKRTFIPGDKWLYYKIYCGARTADIILAETIKPLTEQLLKGDLISQWFFIRYNDPEFHLRIRFYLKDTAHIGMLTLEIYKALAHYVEDNVIYKLQTDTYQREIERYGAKTIALSETLFYHESSMLLKAIETITDEKLYFLFIIRSIDRLLTEFEYGIKEKLHLVSKNSIAFKKEFYTDKKLNKQLDRKYRGIRNELSTFLNASHTNIEYAFSDNILKDKTKQTIEIIQNILAYKKDGLLEVAWDNLISSYIHMLINRAFRSRQRFYELVCYDFLKRYYTTLNINKS